MSDIVERAEAALVDETVLFIAGPSYIRELVAELKAARAQNKKLQGLIEMWRGVAERASQ